MLVSGQQVDLLLSPVTPQTHRSPRLPHRPPPGAPPASAGCCPSLGLGTVLEGEGPAVLTALGESASFHQTPIRPQLSGSGLSNLCVSISVSGSPFLSLFVSIFLTRSLSLPTLSPAGTQEVTKGSWNPTLAALVRVSPRPHPRHICRRLCGRPSAGQIALWAGCRRSCTSGLREEARAWVWLGPCSWGLGARPVPLLACSPAAGPARRALPTWPCLATPQ